MNDEFKIYIDRLKDGKEEVLDETFLPDFIDVKEDTLSFPINVKIRGKVYLVEKELIFQLHLQTVASLNCRICNEKVGVPVSSEIYHVETIENIKGMVFDMRPMLREAILLEIPSIAECNEGKCSQRKNIEKYLVSTVEESGKVKEELHQPFKNLL